jgi:hypothetical protein
MNLTKKSLVATAVSAAAAMAIVGGLPSPAFAGDTSCRAPYWPNGWHRTCTTGTIGPNSQHKIWISVAACKGSPWKVWDTGTGVTIASGKGSLSSKAVGGLYGNYKAKLTDACGRDSIALAS